jgi:hypothetical protein
MTRAEDVAAAWLAVDTATTELGSRVTALIAEINRTASDGLTGPQTEAVLSNLTALAANLNNMGHNPGSPIPPTPTPTPIPGPFA